MKIRSVIFDFGGVLTEKCWDLSYMATTIRDVLREHNINLGSDYDSVFKSIMLEAWNRVVNSKREERLSNLILESLKLFNLDIDSIVVEKIIDRIKDAPFCIVRRESYRVVETLKHMGLVLGIVSNSPIRFHDRILERHGLLSFFDCIVVSCDVGYRKPDPKIFEVALDKLKVSPQESIYVGDVLEIDVPGAKSLGMLTVLMSSPEPAMKDLPVPKYEEPIKPDFVINDLREIINIVRKINGF